MINTSRRAVLTAGASTIGAAFAGCLTDGTDEWETDETIPVTSATMYKGPNCSCCDSYGEHLDASLRTDLETSVTEDLTAVKNNHGIDANLRSCHTIELDDYLIEGHIPAEIVTTLFKDEPKISGIALPGMPPGSPGMGGEKSGTWTVYEIHSGDSPTVYTKL
ncbi:metal-binding protein [Natrinema sp. CBA1119]|uniref:DUF411 domain-containing protein n=1 Tax=Natrinema sp. CBA1119 TaxID=1608465 RepID=UPI000BF7EFB2|nr:DUF411 domain-containing protein [Natrinema sp. CBA1119]PGF14166.1 metal-binding protein [Natrinema sp. CBA1119]